MLLYPICLALNALIMFALAVLWEVTLQPTNPVVPIFLLIISLGGFGIAAHEARA